MKPTILERLLSNSIATPTGCLEWQGRPDSGGYGQIQVGRRSPAGHSMPIRVHVVGYKLLAGSVPSWMWFDHGCRNRRCWLPSLRHVYPVTPKVNSTRNSAGIFGYNAIRTECAYGHDLTVDGAWYYRPDTGHRMCRLCHLVRGNGRRENRRDNYKIYYGRFLKANIPELVLVPNLAPNPNLKVVEGDHAPEVSTP